MRHSIEPANLMDALRTGKLGKKMLVAIIRATNEPIETRALAASKIFQLISKKDSDPGEALEALYQIAQNKKEPSLLRRRVAFLLRNYEDAQELLSLTQEAATADTIDGEAEHADLPSATLTF